MGCPYYDAEYIRICGASGSNYVPTIQKMETFCFQESYRLCPTLSKYLYENDIAMANRLRENNLSHRES